MPWTVHVDEGLPPRTVGPRWRAPQRRVAFAPGHTYTLVRPYPRQVSATKSQLRRTVQMKWETPSYTDLRFGFEVTMYIYNR